MSVCASSGVPLTSTSPTLSQGQSTRAAWVNAVSVTLTGRRGLSGTQFPQLPQSAGQAEGRGGAGGLVPWGNASCGHHGGLVILFRFGNCVKCQALCPLELGGLCPPCAAEPRGRQQSEGAGTGRGGAGRGPAMAPWPRFSLTLPGLVTAPSLQALVPLGACALHPAQTLVPNPLVRVSACGPFPGKIL